MTLETPTPRSVVGKTILPPRHRGPSPTVYYVQFEGSANKCFTRGAGGLGSGSSSGLRSTLREVGQLVVEAVRILPKGHVTTVGINR